MWITVAAVYILRLRAVALALRVLRLRAVAFALRGPPLKFLQRPSTCTMLKWSKVDHG